MTQERDLAAIARSIVDANRFMALGTADASGNPWVSPVWYAPLSYHEYVWVSRPGTRHSANITERPQVAITIYDTHGPGAWFAFYMAAFMVLRRGGGSGRVAAATHREVPRARAAA